MVATRSTAFDWSIQNVEVFQRKLDALGKATNDFRIPFRLISSDFYRSQKQLFTLKGAGLFQDLAPAKGVNGNPTTISDYKKQKKKNLGFVYPILVGQTKNLSQSTLSKNHRNSIFFLNRKELQIGTNISYGKYHQSDKPRSRIPQRKFVFITGGRGDMSKDSGIHGRRERWISIIDTHIEQLLTGRIIP